MWMVNIVERLANQKTDFFSEEINKKTFNMKLQILWNFMKFYENK